MNTNQTFRMGPLVAIVDDDDAMRTSLDSLLRSFGFRTLGFSSGESFFDSNHVGDTACVLLDVRLAGMNGLEVQSRLVASKLRLPVIFMTSFADDAVRARAVAGGAIEFLYKPFSDEQLLGAISKALAS